MTGQHSFYREAADAGDASSIAGDVFDLMDQDNASAHRASDTVELLCPSVHQS